MDKILTLEKLDFTNIGLFTWYIRPGRESSQQLQKAYAKNSQNTAT